MRQRQAAVQVYFRVPAQAPFAQRMRLRRLQENSPQRVRDA
ncbi:hypothetical protein BSU04_25135 [Caballeronia sordidicola]|uniref:Uncharacterized protein n=1 Tax=Caballeronia sordidicola TaxID=196367 RepID=A0A226WYE8_CABSO|nr:hypothetical protein BSU04_25135 [Caballeronia sordidicola]